MRKEIGNLIGREGMFVECGLHTLRSFYQYILIEELYILLNGKDRLLQPLLWAIITPSLKRTIGLFLTPCIHTSLQLVSIRMCFHPKYL